MAFCRSIYVKKVMKLLAFIFEQPSYMKSAGSVLLSLFMRTNGKCNDSHLHQHWLKRISAFLKNQEMKKYQHNIDVWGEVLPTPRSTMTAVATSKYM